MAGVCRGDGPCDTSSNDHGGSNWVSKAGGFPDWFHAIINAMRRKGRTESQAIRLAWGIVRNWAEGKGNVTPETRAKAAAMVARLDAMRSTAHLTAEATVPIDLAASVPYAASNDGPQMTMTVGQHMAALRKLATAHKRAGPSKRPKLRAAMAVHAKAIQTAKAKNLTAAPAPTVDLTWDESQHPRQAGKFAPKGTQTQGAKPKPKMAPVAPGQQVPPAIAAQIRDYQKRMGLPVTGIFDTATKAALTAKSGGGKGGKGGGAKKATKKGGSAATTKQHAAVKSYLKARQTAAKKAAAQTSKAQTTAGKATTAKAATMAAAAKSPAVRAYLKAGAAARSRQLATAKASTARKAAVRASNAKVTAGVAAKLGH